MMKRLANIIMVLVVLQMYLDEARARLENLFDLNCEIKKGDILECTDEINNTFYFKLEMIKHRSDYKLKYLPFYVPPIDDDIEENEKSD